MSWMGCPTEVHKFRVVRYDLINDLNAPLVITGYATAFNPTAISSEIDTVYPGERFSHSAESPVNGYGLPTPSPDSLKIFLSQEYCVIFKHDRFLTVPTPDSLTLGDGPYDLRNYEEYDPTIPVRDHPDVMTYIIDSTIFSQGEPCRR